MAEPRQDWIQFASDLSLMKHRAVTLGMYATAQLMDPSIRMSGFEIAGSVLEGAEYIRQQKAAER